MAEAKPPGGYRFGAGPETFVVVPARICAWLATRTNLGQVRISARGSDAEVYAVLHDIHRAGLEWAAATTSGDDGSVDRKPLEVPPRSKWVSTTQAAGLLGITDRAVRLAINERRIPAERIGRTWRLRRTDVEHYRAAKAA